MRQMNRERAYRDCAVAGATPIGLMVALFDRLALDLRRAAAAIRANDIETRCREINHGFLILGQLENWVDLENGGAPARHLAEFYAHLRARMMQASATQMAQILDQQIETLVAIRSRWQQLDSAPGEPGSGSLPVSTLAPADTMPAPERVSFSLSA